MKSTGYSRLCPWVLLPTRRLPLGEYLAFWKPSSTLFVPDALRARGGGAAYPPARALPDGGSS